MISMDGTADDLVATLVAAETSLRVAAATVLDPAAMMRMERASTRAARAAVAARAATATLELPPGWAEFVEVDEALDALLDRLASAPAPAPAAPPVPRHVPAAVDADDPAEAALAPEPEAPAAFVAADTPVEVLPEVDYDDALDMLYDDGDYAPPVEAPPAPRDDDEEEATVISDAATLAAKVEAEKEKKAAEAAAAPKAKGGDEWVVFEEQPVYEGYEEELDDAKANYHDDGVSYITYTEPDPAYAKPTPVTDDDEDLPAWAAKGGTAPAEPKKPEPKKAAAAPPPPPEPAPEPEPEPESDDEDWAMGEDVLGRQQDDRYASMRGERMRLDDFSEVGEDEALDEAEAVAELDLDVADDVEDDGEPTAITSAGRPRAHAAAIQLTADGGGKVLGVDDDDDADGVIALGDTRDYGDEELMDDDQSGILGVGVVEYDDEDDEYEDDEGDEEELPTSLSHITGAPILTPAEVSALMARAQDVARRNMQDGTRIYSDVLDADPTRLDALLSRGRLSLDLGDFPGAVSDFLKAEALHPKDPDVQVALGDLFYGRKDYGKAVSYFNRALAMDSDHAIALSRRGMAHYYRRQFNAAVEDLTRAKKLDASLAHVDTYISRAKKRA